LKILIVGYGSIGKRHISNLSKIGKLKIIVLTKRKKDNFLKKNNCSIFSKIEDCLKEYPDAAIICNETSMHVKIATKLAKNNIHMFIEKPLSNSLIEINQLKKIVKSKRIITHVGCVLRFHPILKKTKEIIEKKSIGKIKFVHAENGSYLPDWHPNEDYKKSYAVRSDSGGGVILTCIHELDYLIWLFGKIDTIISTNRKIGGLGIKVDDFSTSILEFSNKTIGEMHLDLFQIPKSRFCNIISEKGKLEVNFEKNQLQFYSNKNKKLKSIIRVKDFNKNNMYLDEMEYFLKCIKYNKRSFNDINFGEKVLKTALLIEKSSIRNRKLTNK
jgi:predicted dehydrogenase